MSDPQRRDYIATPRIVVALCVIALGVWWTASNIGWTIPFDLGKYWPIFLIIFGLAKFSSSSSGSGRVLGGVITTIGAWIMLDRLFNIPFHIDDWWPLLLIGWGVLLLMGGIRSRPTDPGAGSSPRLGVPGAAPAMPIGATPRADVRGPSADDKVNAFAMFSGCRRRVMSGAFQRADLAAVMGGVTLDLRQAATATGDAVVDVFVVWGGINIRVPPDWAVSNEVVAIMGGTDDRSTGSPGAKNRLIVRGYVIMGGVEIKP